MTTEEIEAGQDVFDVLQEIDLSSVDTTYPLLAPGVYTMSIKPGSMSREQSKEKEGTYLKMTLVTTEEATNHTGEQILAPGFGVNHIISLVKTDKYDPMKSIAQFHEALGDKSMRFDPTFEAYAGAELTVKITVQPERENEKTGETYPAQNRVASFIKPKG